MALGFVYLAFQILDPLAPFPVKTADERRCGPQSLKRKSVEVTARDSAGLQGGWHLLCLGVCFGCNVPRRVLCLMAPGFHHATRLRYGTRYPSPSASRRVLCVSWYPGHSVLWRVMGDAGGAG